LQIAGVVAIDQEVVCEEFGIYSFYPLNLAFASADVEDKVAPGYVVERMTRLLRRIYAGPLLTLTGIIIGLDDFV